LAYLRRSGKETILVALNFSNSTQPFDLNSAAQGTIQAKTEVLLSTSAAKDAANGQQHTLLLSPYAVYIARINP
jgi:hypothetical protein